MSSEKSGWDVLLRYAFWVYAAGIFVATHWPSLKIKVGDFERPDLVIHMVVFGVWTVLLWASGLVGRRESVKTAVIAGGVTLVYAAFDEGTQALPGLGRTAAWDDYMANALGVVVGTVAAMVGASVLRKRATAPGAVNTRGKREG